MSLQLNIQIITSKPFHWLYLKLLGYIFFATWCRFTKLCNCTFRLSQFRWLHNFTTSKKKNALQFHSHHLFRQQSRILPDYEFFRAQRHKHGTLHREVRYGGGEIQHR